MLKGKKVLLRPIRRLDLANFVRWFNDPEVIQYLGVYLPMTEMAEEKWIEDLGGAKAATQVNLMIEAVEEGGNRAIGELGLSSIHPKDHHATFGILIGEKEYWSRGYGTEAARLLINYGFEQLNLRRINSGVIAFNERSLRLHRRVGFSEEEAPARVLLQEGGVLRPRHVWNAERRVERPRPCLRLARAFGAP